MSCALIIYLVICPNHVAQQWVDELQKFTDPTQFKVVLIALSVDMTRITLKDIVDAGTTRIKYWEINYQIWLNVNSQIVFYKRFHR